MQIDGWNIVGTGLGGKTSIHVDALDINGPVVLVLGNEGDGIEKAVKDICDVNVVLEGEGSLNVGVACGILMHGLVQKFD